MNLPPLPSGEAAAAPHRAIDFGAVDLDCEALPDGGFRMRSRTPLAAHDPSLARMFRAAVERAPDRVFLAERSGEGWRRLTYGECRATVDALAAALIERGLWPERPLMILSGQRRSTTRS